MQPPHIDIPSSGRASAAICGPPRRARERSRGVQPPPSDPTPSGSAFDRVGHYAQDEINGFGPDIRDALLAAAQLAGATTVLDAMCGDGGLALAVLERVRESGDPGPGVTAFDLSSVQLDRNRAELERAGATVVHGDVLDPSSFPPASFDRILLKSALHELPRADQAAALRNLFRWLQPGGRLVLLALSFDDPYQRDEARALAACKDRLAGMHEAEERRYFPLRADLDRELERAGFRDLSPARSVTYSIDSTVMARNYFTEESRRSAEHEFLKLQRASPALLQAGRITLRETSSILRLPAEILAARRPEVPTGSPPSGSGTFDRYGYDFLRRLRVHRELLDAAVEHLRDPGLSILDLGCGPGLLAERLEKVPAERSYLGLDTNQAFIDAAVDWGGTRPWARFAVASLDGLALPAACVDRVVLLNVLYLPTVPMLSVLHEARRALREGGRILVSGPTSPRAFDLARPRMEADLRADGLLPSEQPRWDGVVAANAALLDGDATFRTAREMETLLLRAGFRTILRADEEHFAGQAYFVVAQC